MKRIVIVAGAGYVSGKEIMALELAQGLGARGQNVDFITSSWHDGDMRRRLAASAIPNVVLPIGFISATVRRDCLQMTAEQIWRWPGLLLGYRQYLKKRAPNKIVHTNWHHLLLLWPFLRPDRDIFWLHEIVPDRPQYRRVFLGLARRLLCFVAVSRAVGESLGRIGIPASRIRIVHNGIGDPVPAGEHVAVRTGNLRVAIVGQVGAWKGHEDLLEAFALVITGHPTAELEIWGRGSEEFEDHLKRRSSELGIADRVVWRGFVADRAKIYGHLSICVIPSRFQEPFGLVAVEAGCFGLPVVATRVGGLPEIVKDAENGFLVDSHNPVQLASRLGELMRSAELRDSMGRAARRRATTYFSRDRFVEEFVAVLN